MVISVPLNITVVFHSGSLSLRSRVGSTRLVLIASMGVSDILQASIGYLFQYLAIVTTQMSHFLCKVSSFSITFLALVSMNHITALAIDCYLHICQPWLKDRYPTLPKKLLVLFLVASWLYSFAWSVVPLIGWRGYTAIKSGNCMFRWSPEQNNRRVYIICLFVFCFLIPVLLIITCFTLIQITLYKMRKYAAQQLGSRSNAVQDNKKSERKHLTLSLVITAVYLVVWAPYAVISIAELAGYDILKASHGKMAQDIASILAKSSTIFNPFIYTIARRRFRKRVRRNGMVMVSAVIKQRENMISMKTKTRDKSGENLEELVTSF